MDRNKGSSEKRIFERVKIPLIKASFKYLDPRSWSSYQDKSFTDIKDISMGGISLPGNQDLVAEAPVGVDIKLSPEKDSIRVFGRIVWIKKEDLSQPNYSMGIRFCWWESDKDKKLIKDLIDTQKT